ncbi:MAG TPA: hypothetical protein VI981_04365 [Candidatus Paceibacterota bacterium]
MTSFSTIKKQFRDLSLGGQDELLKDLYMFSKDVRLFLENRLLRGTTATDEYVRQMERETIKKVYRTGTPGIPNGKTVNSIIAKAKKSHVDIHALMTLEQLAYRGFIEFLNEFGGGPESFDDQSCKHLEAYLQIVRDGQIDGEERARRYQELKTYLLAKNNMLTDSLDEAYESVTGISIGR